VKDKTMKKVKDSYKDGMAKGGKVKCATGGKVKLSKSSKMMDGGEMGGEKGYAKGGTVRGMGAAVKGGAYKGCK
jgi:hypothetical protein